MTQEDRKLLLTDLCARLPYEPFAQWHHKALNEFRDVKIMRVSTYGENIDDYHINVLCQPKPGVDYEASIVDIKPYLRPISSMTDEEVGQLFHILKINEENGKEWIKVNDIGIIRLFTEEGKDFYEIAKAMDYLHSIHIDYRCLIHKGLALEAPEGMYKKGE
jgi:hypothetical protein